MAAEASSTIMPVRYLMWGLLGVPHLVLQALRQGLPMIITFIADDLGCSTADKAFLLGAFYPGYTAAMLPGGLAVRHMGAKRLMGLGLAGTAALLAAMPLAAGRVAAGAAASPRALWQLWLVMCGMGVLSAPLMPASTVLQREWMPAWLGTERVWAIKIPMLAMKTGRTVTNLAIPLLAARFGWRAAIGAVYAAATAVAAVAWQAGVSETVAGCSRLSAAERKLLVGPAAPDEPKKPALPIIRFAELADVPTLVALINAAYGSSEGELWEEGDDFKRTAPPEIEGLIASRQLYVACPPDQPAAVAGCVSCTPVESTVAGVDTRVLEFGLLCVSPKHKRAGLATRLIAHSEAVAQESGIDVMQCELLVPRDLALHPHPFKEMMLDKFYVRLGYAADRVLPFEDAYPQVVAHNSLNFECDAVVFQRRLSPAAAASDKSGSSKSSSSSSASAIVFVDGNRSPTSQAGRRSFRARPKASAHMVSHI
jgi:predicted N-acetyltransferase YhbS